MEITKTAKKYFESLSKSIILISIGVMLFSCENDIKTINSLSMVDSLPLEYAFDIEVYYSDSGKVLAYLESPLMKRYEEDDSYMEFPDGFKIVFYDSLLKPKSVITALYGISYEKKKRMEAKNNVVVINHEKNERLDTEHLIWDQNKGIIYSEVFVKITRDEEVLFGDGLTAAQDFSWHEIKNPTGEFQFNPDEE